ncbi:MAG: hypothetical protein AAF602_29790 [Myxococcota bacterium]
MDDETDDFRVIRREGSSVLGIVARAVDDETDETKATFRASTGTEDRMGDFVEQNWRLKSYRSNPVVLYEHRPPVVGRGVVKTATDEAYGRHLVATAHWDVGEHNPTGTLMAAQHARGFRSAVSVGFRARSTVSRRDLPEDDERRVNEDIPRWRAGWVFRSPELLEFSPVAIPANVDAVQLRSWYDAQADGDVVDHPEQLERFLKEFAAKEHVGWILSALRAEPTVRAAVRAALAEDLPPPPPAAPQSVDGLLASLGIC